MTSPENNTSIHAALVIGEETFDQMVPVIRHLAVGLLDYVSEVTLITPSPAAESLSLGPVHVVRHNPLRWPLWDRGLQGILKQLESNPPNTIHAYAAQSFRIASELALALRCPFLGQALSTQDLHADGQHFSQMARLIVASQPLLEQTQAMRVIDDSQLSLIRPGLLTSTSPHCFAQEQQCPSIICMSPYEPQSCVDHLIQAIRQLVDEGRRVMLFLLGKGPLERRYRKLVEGEGLIDHVTFGGVTYDWDATMRSADVFVVPSAQEHFNIRLLHALAAGMAIVAGESKNSDFLIHGHTGQVCTASTPAALAKAIRELLDDPQRARQMSSQGISYCKKHHSLSAMADMTARAYRDVLM